MRNTIEEVFIPFALSAAGSWMVTYVFKIGGRYQAVCILSVFLVAVFLNLWLKYFDAKEAEQDASERNRLFRRLTAVAAILAMAIALFSGAKGYLVARQLQAPGDATHLQPNGQDQFLGSFPVSAKPESEIKEPTTSQARVIPPRQSVSESLSKIDDFVHKYVDEESVRKSSQPLWSVLISDSYHSSFPELNSEAAAAVTEAGYGTAPIFRPALIRDDKLDEVYDADPVLVHKLGKICGGFIVAKVNSSLRQDSAGLGTYTTDLSLEVRIVQVPSGLILKQFTISEHGAGFTATDAESNATERAAKTLKEKVKAAM